MKSRVIITATVAVLATFAWLAVAHPLGLRFAIGTWPVPAGTPWTYQLLSGFLASLAIISIFTALFGAYHLNNCHKRHCPRLGKHKIGGTPWCDRHQHLGRPETTDSDRLDKIIALLEAQGQKRGILR